MHFLINYFLWFNLITQFIFYGNLEHSSGAVKHMGDNLTGEGDGDDEQIEARVNRFEGDAVVLTRENTEPANRSITTKKQAELLCEDGKWFIANHSEWCSTALEVNRKMELQSGDIIILGDRRFLFEEEA